MKSSPLFSLLAIVVLLLCACQPSDDPALDQVQSAMAYYRAGDAGGFEQRLTVSLRQTSIHCPEAAQYGCLRLAYQNFATEQHTAAQQPQSFTFFAYDRQTAPNVRMVLVEGDWGSNPAVVSCQVFFALTDGALWLIDNYDAPQAMTCRQRSDELTVNLFGAEAVTPSSP